MEEQLKDVNDAEGHIRYLYGKIMAMTCFFSYLEFFLSQSFFGNRWEQLLENVDATTNKSPTEKPRSKAKISFNVPT